MDSPLLCTSFSHFASQLVPARNGKFFRWWLPNCKSQRNGGCNSIFKHLLRTRKCFLLTGHFHRWKQSGKKDTQVERRDVPGPFDTYQGQIHSPWCTKQRTYFCLPLTTEDRRKKNAVKTIGAFAQIYLLKLGEKGQSKDLSPIEREHWPWWWWTI